MRLAVLITAVCGIALAEESTEDTPKPSKPIAVLDISNTENGSYPGGATPKKGKWKVDKETERLEVAPEPLDRAWLEFGPEIRERGATIIVKGQAPGEARIRSRLGAGLYGDNGFQIEAVPATGEVELIRRGATLSQTKFSWSVEKTYYLELSVTSEDENWRVSGRVWEEGSNRPEKALFAYRMFASELLFPLAGRSVLTATPFSGEAPVFASAEVYDGIFVPEPVDEKNEEQQDQDDEKDGEE